MNRRETGSSYERAAAIYLQKLGYQILEMNYKNPMGEIDIVARQEHYLVFIEVKYRKDAGSGWAAEAVDKRKQQRLRKAAGGYLLEKRFSEDTPCRFDVAAIDGSRVTLIKDAF